MHDVDNSRVVRSATRRGRTYGLCLISAWLLVGALWVGSSVRHAPVAYAGCARMYWSPNAGTIGTLITAQGSNLICSFTPANPLTLYVVPGDNTYYPDLCTQTNLPQVTVATVSYDPTGTFTTTFHWPAAAHTPGDWSICSKDANGSLTTISQNAPFTFSSPTATPTSRPKPTATAHPTATSLPTTIPTSTLDTLTPTATSSVTSAGAVSGPDHQPPSSTAGPIVGGISIGVLVLAAALFLFWRKPWQRLGMQAPSEPLLSPPPDADAGSAQP